VPPNDPETARLSTTALPKRGFLASVGVPGGNDVMVRFQFNPLSVEDSRRISYATLNAPCMLMPVRQYTAGGDRTISFTVAIDGLFAGQAEDSVKIDLDPSGSIQPEIDKYRAFVYPQHAQWANATKAEGGFASIYRDVDRFTAPPSCRFGFGHRVVECVVSEVDVKATLFNADLEPLRAEVAVSLVEIVPYHPANIAGRA
jgi:Contractile injection system tube protein